MRSQTAYPVTIPSEKLLEHYHEIVYEGFFSHFQNVKLGFGWFDSTSRYVYTHE